MSSTYVFCAKCDKINRIPIDASLAKTPICGNCKAELHVDEGVVELSAAQLALLAKKSPIPLVVDFWAPWCGPCRTFAPTFKQAAKEFAGRAVFAKVNTEQHPLAADSYHIRSIPTLVVIQNGMEKDRQSGALPAPAFKQYLTGVLK